MPETALQYFKAERNKHTEPYRKFYDEAIAALEKQVPKKVVRKNSLCRCPYCNDAMAIFVGDKRCCCCGQALDWTE